MASVLMASEGALGAHTGLTNNPHAVTKAQVGLGNVDNTADTNKPVSTAMRAALVLKQDKLSDAQMAKVNNALTNANAFDAAGAASAALAAHLAETNPHVITKEALGLGNVNNTSDVNKPISTATQTALNAKQDKLTAGDNITIAADGTISATGGGTPEDYEIVRTNAATGATHAAKTDNPHGVTAAQVGADAAGSAAAAKAAAIADAAGKYLPKTSVVAPSSTATTGQAADAKATYDELAKRVEMSPYGDITLTDGSATVQIYPYEIYFSDPSHNLVNYLAFPGYENDDTTLKREGSFDFLATRPWVDYQYLRKGDNAAGLTPTAKSALFSSDGFKSAIRYPDETITDGALKDYTVNKITASGTAITLTAPDKTDSKGRDFLLRLSVTAETQVTWFDCETKSGETWSGLQEIESGKTYIYRFTDCGGDKLMASRVEVA